MEFEIGHILKKKLLVNLDIMWFEIKIFNIEDILEKRSANMFNN